MTHHCSVNRLRRSPACGGSTSPPRSRHQSPECPSGRSMRRSSNGQTTFSRRCRDVKPSQPPPAPSRTTPPTTRMRFGARAQRGANGGRGRRGFRGGPGAGQRGRGRGGYQQQQPQHQQQQQRRNYHPNGPPPEGCCPQHKRWGKSAWYCTKENCPMKNFTTTPIQT